MKRSPRVLICNERFLARFGVDRILVLLAEHLAGLGAKVEFACIRCDRAVLERISGDIDEVTLPHGLDPVGADRFISDHLREAWKTAAPPDVVVTGGWPFFGAAAQAGAFGIRSLFIDAGAVPHDGIPDFALPTQLELRRLRQITLPDIGVILPISDFIRQSQTEADRGSDRNVHTVLLGADHLATRTFDRSAISPEEAEILRGLENLSAKGARLLIALGRYEAYGYKNSAAAFDVLRALKAEGQAVHLVILAGQEVIRPPPDLVQDTSLLATISDAGLQAVMELCVLGLSLTRWEGFNLPLVEMQWLGKPALAFNIGAHPEVTALPWFLCETTHELIGKARALLAGTVSPAICGEEVFQRFRDRFHWRNVLDRWAGFILDETLAAPCASRRTVIVDVSNSARDPANSGVIRVTRRVAAGLQKLGKLNLVFAVWDHKQQGYRWLTQTDRDFLASNAGPTDWLSAAADQFDEEIRFEAVLHSTGQALLSRPILFIPEVVLDDTAQARVKWAKDRNLATAAILYDVLPLSNPQLVSASVLEAFPAYAQALTECEALCAISSFSLSEFHQYFAPTAEDGAAQREAVWLPGQFSDYPRVQDPEPQATTFQILCVSTIEPRKNHRTLLEAFQRLIQHQPGLPLRLVLVGNRYGGAEDLTRWIEGAIAKTEQIVWHGNIPDMALAELYQNSAFTVYPSLVEGFGLPILESLWMGKPCLCHNRGVMAELAAGGGCMMVDMADADQLAEALGKMITTPSLRRSLSDQARRRQISTWQDYANALADRLLAIPG
ncbi:glycosyltransferase [Plastoroseomonas hellenica]|uniref:glycosyltransferase n=1 Tax=Plastoroseomonas hellenica TaxID=2687306 RepID=UPI001BAABC5F|nr:glycosyltransferase [Plastoroseomonas hellenica]MBR0644698.1 glycosyltransferase [Plastoroseomonas hellenica]